MIGYPLDSHVSFDEDGIPQYDRAISSEPFRKLLRELFPTGVLPATNNLKVVAGAGMEVTVNAGFAMVDGCMKLVETAETLTIEDADSQARIDTVVIRLDDNDAVRECELYVVKGTPASYPVHPDLTREGSVYEIGIADINVPAGASSVSVIDTRTDSTRCGIIDSLDQVPTLVDTVDAHITNNDIHITSAERSKWNSYKVAVTGNVTAQLSTITASTTDITAGTTALTTGQLYVVYE